MGLGLEKVGLVGGELFKGPAFSVSKARAPEVSSTGKEREERGDKDLFGGASREVSLSKTVGVVDRAAITDEALLAEVSRYDNSPSFFVGVRVLSFSLPSSGFGRALVVSESFGLGGLVAADGAGDQNPLSIILVDGSAWEMASKGEKNLAEERVGGSAERIEDEGLL